MSIVEQLQAERDRAGVMFVEIAHTAHVIKRLASMLTGNGVTSLEDESFVLVALESLAERADLLADLGASTCGQVATVGGVAEWMMPNLPTSTPKE